METEREEFLQALNQARIERHYSVRGAAKAAGVPAATMQGWLAGRHYPTPALRPKFQTFIDLLELSPELVAGWWGASPQWTYEESIPERLTASGEPVDDVRHATSRFAG